MGTELATLPPRRNPTPTPTPTPTPQERENSHKRRQNANKCRPAPVAADGGQVSSHILSAHEQVQDLGQVRVSVSTHTHTRCAPGIGTTPAPRQRGAVPSRHALSLARRQASLQVRDDGVQGCFEGPEANTHTCAHTCTNPTHTTLQGPRKTGRHRITASPRTPSLICLRTRACAHTEQRVRCGQRTPETWDLRRQRWSFRHRPGPAGRRPPPDPRRPRCLRAPAAPLQATHRPLRRR